MAVLLHRAGRRPQSLAFMGAPESAVPGASFPGLLARASGLSMMIQVGVGWGVKMEIPKP